jgi:hypothetical protein
VAIGAAATTITLAFELFVQAVVSFNGSMGPFEGGLEAHLARSDILDAGSYFSDGFSGLMTFLPSSNKTANFEPYTYQPDLEMV